MCLIGCSAWTRSTFRDHFSAVWSPFLLLAVCNFRARRWMYGVITSWLTTDLVARRNQFPLLYSRNCRFLLPVRRDDISLLMVVDRDGFSDIDLSPVRSLFTHLSPLSRATTIMLHIVTLGSAEGLLMPWSDTAARLHTLLPYNLQNPLFLAHHDLGFFLRGQLLTREHLHQHVLEVCHAFRDCERVLHCNAHECIEGFHSYDHPLLLRHELEDGAKKSYNKNLPVEESRPDELRRLYLVFKSSNDALNRTRRVADDTSRKYATFR